MVELGCGGWGLHSLSDGEWLIGSAVRGSRSMYPSPRGGGRYFIFPLSAGHGGRVQRVSKQNKHNPFQVRRLSRARFKHSQYKHLLNWMISVKYIYWFLCIDVLFQIEIFLNVPGSFFCFPFLCKGTLPLKAEVNYAAKVRIDLSRHL